MKTLKYLIILSAIGFFSCDDHNPDFGPAFDLEVIAFPNQPVIVNPAIISGSPVKELVINAGPANGLLELVDNNRLLRYLPNQAFQSGNDNFSLRMTDDQGTERLASVNVRIGQNGDCDRGGVFDHIIIQPGDSLVLDLLDNDVFCGGGDITSGLVGETILHASEGHGDIPQIALNTAEDAVLLLYAAPVDFTGTIDLIYEVGVNYDFSNHGEPFTFPDGTVNTRAFDDYVIAQATIDVVN